MRKNIVENAAIAALKKMDLKDENKDTDAIIADMYFKT